MAADVTAVERRSLAAYYRRRALAYDERDGLRLDHEELDALVEDDSPEAVTRLREIFEEAEREAVRRRGAKVEAEQAARQAARPRRERRVRVRRARQLPISLTGSGQTGYTASFRDGRTLSTRPYAAHGPRLRPRSCAARVMRLPRPRRTAAARTQTRRRLRTAPSRSPGRPARPADEPPRGEHAPEADRTRA